MAAIADTLSRALQIYNDRYQAVLNQNSKREIERYLSNTNQINSYYDIVYASIGENNIDRANEALDEIVAILHAEGILISEPVVVPYPISVNVYPSTILIPTDQDGLNPDYTNAVSVIYIFQGSVDNTSNWLFTITGQTDVTAVIQNNNEIKVNDLTADQGSIEITATQSGISDTLIYIPVQKQKQGESGGGTVQNANLSIIAKDEGTPVGNARGAGSVDLQVERSSVIHVASGDYSFIGSGSENSVTGNESSLISGFNSRVGGNRSFIGSGSENSVDGDRSFIGSGSENRVTGQSSAVVAGENNNIVDANSFIGAGEGNSVSGPRSAVVTGSDNIITGQRSVVVAGFFNEIFANYSFIGSGENNQINDDYGAILCGNSNQVDGYEAVILSGNECIAAGNRSIVLGGGFNTASGSSSLVLTGSENESLGSFSCTTGAYNKAESFCEVVIGMNGLFIPGSPTTYNALDPIFRVGNGSNDQNKSDAFKILKNGGVFMHGLKSGANQGAAGASADELWIDTADNSIKIGV